jgi:predicted aspartyl protease
MRLLTLLLAAVFAVAPITVRADDTAVSLLAKHKAFVGWTFGEGPNKTFRLTETVTQDKDGKLLRSTDERRVGVVFRSDTRDMESGTQNSTGFTGNIFWRSDENGFTVPVIGDPAKAELASDLVFAEATTQLPAALHGTQTIDGKTYQVLRLTPSSSLPIDVYVDADTGAYKRVTIDPNGTYEQTFDILAYGEASPGQKIISKWKYQGSVATHTLTKISAGAAISDDELHPPAQTASWTFANQNPIPFKMGHFRIILDAKFNGVPGKFILDTGASGIFLTKSFADRARLQSVGKSTAGGIGGSISTQTVKADSFDIGGNVLKNVVVNSQDLHLGDEGSDGLIGFGLLAGTFTTLDFTNSTIQIQDPSNTNASSLPGVHVAADLSTGTPVVPTQVNGNIPLNALLDTGAPTHMLIPYDLVSKYGLRMLIDNSLEGYFNSHQIVAGVGGYEVGECGSLDTVKLGPIVYDHPSTCKSQSFDGNDGLIGLDFLKGFDKIYFDYPHTQLILVPKRS